MKSNSRGATGPSGRRIAAWLGAAVALVAPGVALAAQVILMSPTSAGLTVNQGTNSVTALCPYASVLGDKEGNLTFSCTGTALDAMGTLAINLSGTSAAIPVNGSTSFAITRTGGVSGDVFGKLGVTGGCSLSNLTVDFTNGSAVPIPATVTLTPGAATVGGNCDVTLLDISSAPVGTPKTFSVGITAVTAPATVLSLNTGATAGSIPVATGSTTVSVTRTGGLSGAASANLAVTSGSCTLSASSVSFADNNTAPSPASVTVNAGSAAAGSSCQVTLTPVSPATPGNPTSVAIGVVEVSTAGQISLSVGSTASSIPASTGSTAFSATRTGGTSGAVSASLSVTGGCTLSASSISFATGSASPSPASVTISAGSAPAGGSCTISLGAVSPATTGSPSSHSVSISSNQPPPGCTTTATEIVPYVADHTNQMFKDLKAGETLAILVDSNVLPLVSRSNYYMSVVEGGGMSGGADIQFTLSSCPGDFAAGVTYGTACARHTTQFGDSITFKAGTPVTTRPPTCWMPSGTTKMYFNIRPIKLPTPVPPDGPGVTSCPVGQLCRFSFALSR